MIDRVLLSAAINKNLLALQRTQSLIDQTTERLATGKKINTALDGPQSFFDARALDNRASDLARKLDEISTGIRTVETAVNGVTAIERLLNLAKSYAESKLEELRAGDSAPITPTVPLVDPLNVQILADNPVAYWRLNETAGATAVNLGSTGAATNGTYLNNPTLGSPALYGDGDVAVTLDGVNQAIRIPDSPQINLGTYTNRTTELVFNANSTAGRQVLYEEGATVNALSIYIDNGMLYVQGRDQGAWGPVNISIPIVAGQTYHVAYTFDSVAGEFIGYVNGVNIGQDVVTATFPSHSGDIGIGFMNGSNWFHDGAQSGTGLYFNGTISDVAIYNDTLDANTISNHAASVLGQEPTSSEDEEFNRILDQITRVTIDASYRGINLLGDEDLLTLLNEDNSSSLTTEGDDLTSRGLGILRSGFDTEAGIVNIIESVDEARRTVERYARSLTHNINILKTRETFTKDFINTLKAGSDDLTNADINEEGVNLLATQTRQQLAFSSLAFANESNNRFIDLIS